MPESQRDQVQSASIMSEEEQTGSSNESLAQTPLTASAIQAWLIDYMADVLDISPEEIDVTVAFDRYGLDSAAAVGLTGDLGGWLDRDLDANLASDYNTIELLAQHLADVL